MIRIERPGLTLDYQDLATPIKTENKRTEGMLIHVRERFSWKVFKRAINFFDSYYECKLIEQNAIFCRTPIKLNDKELSKPLPPTTTIDHMGGKIWLDSKPSDNDANPRDYGYLFQGKASLSQWSHGQAGIW